MNQTYKRLVAACYTCSVSMSVVGNLPPILFLTFRSLYGISYSLLGLLVAVNFITQLIVDLIFSFFSHKFDISKAVKRTPLLTLLGLLIYAIWPFIMPNAVYPGLLLGTVIFSAAAGLNEVLISPVIAAIPAEDPDREMSKLHSIYAWGVVGVILFATAYILLFGAQYWQWLILLSALVPLSSLILFSKTEIPAMETPEQVSGALSLLANKGIWLCVFAIFLGGSAECSMAQWASGYLEQAIGIPKVWGDILGVALFGMTLGLGRTLYAKCGKNIEKVLLLCAISSTACYVLAVISPLPWIGLFACAFTGFCTSMLWPGSLIVASGRFPTGGVFIYALMAAGGDMGAAVGPQLIGLITDVAIMNPTVQNMALQLSMTPEQLGMKCGMLAATLFPLLAIPAFARILKTKK